MVLFTDKDGNTASVDPKDIRVRISAYAIVIKDDQILLLPDREGHDLPGGGVEVGEPILDGLKREVFEETGIEVEPLHIVDVQDSFFWMKGTAEWDGYLQSACLFYLCKITGGTLSSQHQDAYEKAHAGEPLWYPLSVLDSITWTHSVPTRPIVEQVLNSLKKTVN